MKPTGVPGSLPAGLLPRYKAAFIPSYCPPFAIQTLSQQRARRLERELPNYRQRQKEAVA